MRLERAKPKAIILDLLTLPAPTHSCIYAATSAGDFTKTVLKHDSSSASSSTAPANQLLTIEATHRLSLPEPLQSVVFYPASHPSNFLYGGEEIPLSIWNIDTALSTPPSTQNEANDSETYTAPNGEAAAAATGENSKMRKRKRQAEARAKAKELLWGEVWRAKNVRARKGLSDKRWLEAHRPPPYLRSSPMTPFPYPSGPTSPPLLSLPVQEAQQQARLSRLTTATKAQGAACPSSRWLSARVMVSCASLIPRRARGSTSRRSPSSSRRPSSPS